MKIYNIGWLYNDDTEYKSASALCKNYNLNVVHIKKIICKGKVVNYYWNNKYKEIIKGSGSVKNISNMLSLSYVYVVNNLSERKQVQIGDSVMIYKKLTNDSESFIFGYVTGFMCRNDKASLEISRISLDKNIDGTIIRVLKDESVPVYFLSDGVKDRHADSAATNNLLRVKYKYQIDAAEFILANAATVKIIWDKYSKRELPLGEVAFKDIHSAMFGKIYPWGGVYRTHEVVVGDRNRDTIDSKDIEKSMRSCFRKVSKNKLAKVKTKEDLAMILTELHRELAWIHPFEDGNGRSIRMYLLILSLSLGYFLNLGKFTGNNKKKAFYHYAVRKCIYDSNKRYLYEIICDALKSLR